MCIRRVNVDQSTSKQGVLARLLQTIASSPYAILGIVLGTTTSAKEDGPSLSPRRRLSSQKMQPRLPLCDRIFSLKNRSLASSIGDPIPPPRTHRLSCRPAAGLLLLTPLVADSRSSSARASAAAAAWLLSGRSRARRAAEAFRARRGLNPSPTAHSLLQQQDAGAADGAALAARLVAAAPPPAQGCRRLPGLVEGTYDSTWQHGIATPHPNHTHACSQTNGLVNATHPPHSHIDTGPCHPWGCPPCPARRRGAALPAEQPAPALDEAGAYQ